jgi:hypothetical protein
MPQRLKPGLFCGTYGAAEAAPFQNKIKNQSFAAGCVSRTLSKQNQNLSFAVSCVSGILQKQNQKPESFCKVFKTRPFKTEPQAEFSEQSR